MANYNPKNKTSTKIEQIIIYMYSIEGLSSYKIANILKISQTTISGILRRNNIKIKGTKFYNRKYTINEDYFGNINSIDKAYFLGLLIADGSITKNNIKLSLQYKDIEILEKFKIYINSNAKIKNGINKSINQRYIVFSSIKIVSDLKNLGLIKNKTHHTYFPDIPEEYWSHFIRGVFDGDGCIAWGKSDKTLRISIIGNNLLIEKIQDILVKECLLKKNKLHNPKKCENNIVMMQYGGNKQIEKIYNYLYKDCDDLCLIRKKEKFNKNYWNI